MAISTSSGALNWKVKRFFFNSNKENDKYILSNLSHYCRGGEPFLKRGPFGHLEHSWAIQNQLKNYLVISGQTYNYLTPNMMAGIASLKFDVSC